MGPLIGRIWRGRMPREVSDEYLRYNREAGLAEIARKPGCVGVQQFRRIDGDIAEVSTITYWTSMEAMGGMHDDEEEDVLRVAPLPRDPEFLLELPERVELIELHVNDWR
jgi:hypothetical protein